MPELPEVETTKRGIARHIEGKKVVDVIVRNPRLRHPVSSRLARDMRGQAVMQVDRRGKYLLLRMSAGTAIVHLGMSGSLRIVTDEALPGKHDHVDIVFEGGYRLRLRDPRRFGLIVWTRQDPVGHALLKSLGVEPLSDDFTGDYLYERSRGRKVAVKSFIMDSRMLVGVGNIYANEALFLAGVHPQCPAGKLTLKDSVRITAAIKQVLNAAIAAGGTTLRDFVNGEGRPGYFARQLRVYGRTGQLCPKCRSPIEQVTLGQRSTYFCRKCQN